MTRQGGEGRRRHDGLSSESAAVALAQALSMAAGLITGIVIARELGPSGRGAVSITLLMPTLGALVLGFGSSVSNVYLIGSRRLQPSVVIPISLALCAFGTVGGWSLLAGLETSGLLPRWVPHLHRNLVVLAGLDLPMVLIYTSLRSALRGLQRIRLAAVIDIIQALASALATLAALVVLNGGVTAAIVANIIGCVVGLAAMAVVLRPFVERWRPALPRGATREVVSFGVRGDLANLTQFFTYRFDSFLVNAIRTTSAVGVYSVATRFAELAWVLPGAVATVVVSRTSARDRSSARSSTPRAFGAVLAMSILASLVLLVVGRSVITAVYSSSFSAAYRPMEILLPGVALLGGATVLTGAVTGLGRPGLNTVNSLVGMAVTLGLDVMLIPAHGLSGAAIASSVAYGINSVLALVFFLRVADLSPATFMAHMLGRPDSARGERVGSSPPAASRGGK